MKTPVPVTDLPYRKIVQEADQITKGVINEALELVRDPERNRPKPKDKLSEWLMGRNVA